MSGWTALTIHADDEETNERIDRELREKYEGSEPYTAEGYADRTVQVGRHANHRDTAKEFAEQFPEAEYIVVVSANDTSDTGTGSLFQVTLCNDGSKDGRFNQHPTKQIDSETGYQGARGKDVTGYFRREYGLQSYCTYEA